MPKAGSVLALIIALLFGLIVVSALILPSAGLLELRCDEWVGSDIVSWSVAIQDQRSGADFYDNAVLAAEDYAETGGQASSRAVEGNERAGSVWHVSPLGSDATGDGSLTFPFRTIQNGIDHTTDGDTVLVQDGTYHERFSFYSKAIIVGSWILRDADTLHITNTVIDGDSTGLPPSDTLSVVRIIDVVGVPALSGFTIKNGPTEGILCAGAGASVRDCILIGNYFRKTYGNMSPTANPSLVRCHLVSCGIGTRSGPLELLQCEIDGLMEGDGPEAMVDADSCVLGDVEIFGTGYFHARSSLIRGHISCVVAGRNLVNCTVNGVISSIDASLVADSCILGGIRCGNESFSWVYRSIIKGPIKFSPSDLPPWLTLSHCTVVDSILRVSGNAKIWLDSSNLVLPAPIDLGGLQTWEYLSVDANCSNVYANGLDPWLNVGSSQYASFDTLGITSLPPQFCNPGLGDYSIFDTSPCAPANNPCGVLIGARDIGCLNEHVWHVATTGNDSLGNGTEAAPFATIQKGIDRAVDGDTVLVEDGLYHERISFLGKGVVVASMYLRDADIDHVYSAIIDGSPDGLPSSDTGSVVRFVNDEDSTSVLIGFSIQGGTGTPATIYGSSMVGPSGGGMFLSSSSPAVRDCRFIDNQTQFGGAIASLAGSDPTMLRCYFAGNDADSADIYAGSGDISFDECEIRGSGSGFFIKEGFPVTLRNSSAFDCGISGVHYILDITSSRLERSPISEYLNTVHLQGDTLVDTDLSIGDERVLTVKSSILENCDVNLHNCSSVTIDSSLIIGQLRAYGGMWGPTTITNSTFLGPGIEVGARKTLTVTNSIISTNGSAAIRFPSTYQAHLYVNCSNVFGFEGNDSNWIEGSPIDSVGQGTFDTTAVSFLDPKLCDPVHGDYHIFDTSPCAPANNSCGVQIGAYGIGCLDSEDDNWSFGNSEANLWPSSWWQQFNYCFGISPCNQLCLLCAPSTFPDWDLFVSAIGEDQAYLDPPPGDVSFRPSAVAQWEAIRGDWTGSCFGFAATSFLFFDDYLRVDSVFSSHTNLSTVPLSGESRQLINKFYLYQFGHSQQQRFNDALTTTTPAQTLTECQSMFARIPRNDQVLMMFNQDGPGGHAVAPYRCIQSGSDPDLWYLYVHDSNLPNDTTQRVTIDLESESWSYSGLPDWGGRSGLFLADSVSSYLLPLVLADTTEDTRRATAYFGKADSVLVISDSDSLGFDPQGQFGAIEGASPIVPADGAETMPIGYLLPTGEWYFRGSGVVDGVFTVVDGQKRIFRNGGAKSGIISCNYRTDATVASLTAYGWSPVKGTRDIYDSSFIEVISIEPDSEIVVNISGLSLMQGDSLTLTLNNANLLQVDNFGSETSYDLEIQIVTQTQDTSFYTEDIVISSSTSHLITPDWRPAGDSIVIAIDTSMSGVFDSTIVIANGQLPQFLCGDADGSNLVTISDAVYLINYIFAGGPPPSPTVRGDADCNGLVTISDAVYLIQYIFGGGPQPCAGCP